MSNLAADLRVRGADAQSGSYVRWLVMTRTSLAFGRGIGPASAGSGGGRMVAVGARSEPYLTGARRIPAELWDAGAEARQRVAEAGIEARALVESARAQAEAIPAQAAAGGGGG